MSDSILRVGLAQLTCAVGEVSANVQKMVEYSRRASQKQCDLVVFPEMCDTGYHMPTIVEKASSWSEAPFGTLAQTARENQIAIIAGLSERVGTEIFNTVAVIDSSGQLWAKYRKIHLITAEPICEHQYLKSGESPTLFCLKDFTIGLMICYDIRFPELARKLTLSGAELLLVPAAFPLLRIAHWKIINQCRAIENQVYYAAVNRSGEDLGTIFGGCSTLYDPAGTILTSASESEETLLVGEISKEKIRGIRDRLRVLQDRRPQLYS